MFREAVEKLTRDGRLKGHRLRWGQIEAAIVGDETQYDRAWVETETGLPQGVSKVHRVDFEACALPIEIEWAPRFRETKPRADLWLMEAKETEESKLTRWKLAMDGPGFHLRFDEHFPMPDQFTLTTIAAGRYRLAALVEGVAYFLSEPFEVKAKMAPLRMKLEKGHRIHASISVPTNGRRARDFGLFKDGEDVTAQYQDIHMGRGGGPLFTGVPNGIYELRVFSTEESMRKSGITEVKLGPERGPPDEEVEVDCEGLTIDFTIDDSTPPVLDLGKLKSKPVPEMRAKAGPMEVITGGAPPP